jgi:serine/threonine protein kinase
MLTALRTLKIGDFGLSKTLSVRNKLPQEMSQAFNMTGETGSYRYMAPEVFRHEFYGPAVDVYAASMIYYQLFSFQQPFSGRNPVDACRAAALENMRPPMREGYMPPELSALVTRMWDPVVKKRPSFIEIIDILVPIVEKLQKQPDASATPGCCTIS